MTSTAPLTAPVNPALLTNPYEELYKQAGLNIKDVNQCTRDQAESLARHLGYIHNVFGIAIKDFIQIVKFKFAQTLHAPKHDPNQQNNS